MLGGGSPRRLRRSFGRADRNLHFGTKTTPELHMQLAFADGERRDVHLAATEDDRLRVMSGSVGGPPAARNAKEPQNADIEMFVRSCLKRWRVYHFHDTGKGAPILCNSELNDNRFLREDGGNLAAFLDDDGGLLRHATVAGCSVSKERARPPSCVWPASLRIDSHAPPALNALVRPRWPPTPAFLCNVATWSSPKTDSPRVFLASPSA